MDNNPKKIETFSDDMIKVISHPEEGLIKQIIHEQEAHEAEQKNLSPQSSKNRVFLAVSAILILLSFSALAFFFFKKDIHSLSVQPQFVPLIFTEENDLVEISGIATKAQITESVLEKVKDIPPSFGTVDGIYLTKNKKAIGLRELMTLIGGKLFSDQDSFLEDNFLMGIVNRDTKDLFFLLKMRSVTDIFPQMRAWENKIFLDMHGFFGVDITPLTSYLLTKNFEDGVVQNKNARILYDKDGKIVLGYVYADDNSLIIFNTEDAVREVVLRLVSSRVKK